MKTMIILLLLTGPVTWCRAQSAEVQQLLLNYEKLLQLKNILADMKKGYELVSTGYNAVRDISRGNFDLHDTFLAGLKAVNPAIRNYHRVAEIVGIHKNILKEYKAAFNQFRVSDLLTDGEIRYLDQVYAGLFTQSLRDADDLLTVISASGLSMTDEDRLTAIDRIHSGASEKLQFLRSFNTRTRILVLQRDRELRSTGNISKLYQTK